MPIIPISGSAVSRGAMIPLGSYTFPNSTLTGMGFGNIPQGYQDLMIVANYGFTANVAPAYIINAGGQTHSITSFSGDGVSVATQRLTNYPYGLISQQSVIQTTAQQMSQSIMHVMSYASTTTFKSILHTNSFGRVNSGTVDIAASLIQTLSPITSISLSTADGSKFFQASTTVTLYGVRSVGQ
jgi:hypothetical protein